jgi:hypothetical protein
MLLYVILTWHYTILYLYIYIDYNIQFLICITWYYMILHDVAWYHMIWFDMIWYDHIQVLDDIYIYTYGLIS